MLSLETENEVGVESEAGRRGESQRGEPEKKGPFGASDQGAPGSELRRQRR